MDTDIICCTPKRLPPTQLVEAANAAVRENPLNHTPLHQLAALVPGFAPTRENIAVLTTKYWPTAGVRLSVSFLDNAPPDLQARILAHMNSWGERCYVLFALTAGQGDVRIARTPGDGYWSYLGTDIQLIDPGQPTMNLDSFTLQTPESEYKRVVRHETGHTIGCPHEHMRRELVNLIDPDKAIRYFGAIQGWDENQVRQQVLTPIEESSLWGPAHADANSIMCYQIPGAITRDGNPIAGGTDIDEEDFAFMAIVYPKALTQ